MQRPSSHMLLLFMLTLALGCGGRTAPGGSDGGQLDSTLPRRDARTRLRV
ncbi:MAG: hypothetical protein JRH20_18745 [Deltaproteobacteria bacterium]|nr:hypothetical protein [Deltaproteobacteria bacterium]